MKEEKLNKTISPLILKLAKLRLRISIQRWANRVFTFFIFTASISCLWLVLTRFFPVLGDPIEVSAAILAAGIIAATLDIYRKRISITDAALLADEKLDLKERFTSAVELANVDSPMVTALHTDAMKHADRLDVSRQFPFAVGRAMKYCAVPMLLFGLIYAWLPEIDLFDYRDKQEIAQLQEEARQDRVKQLKTLAKAIEPQPDKKWNMPKEFSTEIDRIAQDLEQSSITDKQALARLSALDEELKKWQKEAFKDNPVPKLAGATSNLKMTKDIADNIQKGEMKDAAKKIRDLNKKIGQGGLSRQELKTIEQELSELSKSLDGNNSEMAQKLAEQLAKASSGLEKQEMDAVKQALEEAGASMEDMQSALEQLKKMENLSDRISQWQQEMTPSQNCRACGKKLSKCKRGEKCKPGEMCYGMCASCDSKRAGNKGMQGPGRGRGGQAGDLPDAQTSTNPTTIPGPVTKGKALATILQRSAPQTGAEPTLDFVKGTFIQAQQENEQALIKEEIPPGSKEFVRRYFSTIEPEE